MEPERILVAGDTHNHIGHKEYLCQMAVDHNCDVIFQLGDWGYLPHFREGHNFIEATRKFLDEFNLVEYFLDGNHDSFDALWGMEWPITNEGFYRLQERLFYAPRGLRWVWSGVRFLALGGAYSHDQALRIGAERRMGTTRFWYWPEETISEGDLYRATLSDEPIDIMFTHDCPADVRIPGFRNFFGRSSPAYTNRRAILSVMEALKPKRLYHGHLHHRYDTTLVLPKLGIDCAIHGVAQYGQGERSWMVIDCKEFLAWISQQSAVP